MHFGIGVLRALFFSSSVYRFAFLPSGIDTAFLVWEHVDTPLGSGNFGRFAINDWQGVGTGRCRQSLVCAARVIRLT
jgi:hypothetical protein